MSAARTDPSAGAPRYFGTTSVTRCPRRARARGSAVLTSARPPVLPKGRASDVTKRMSSGSAAGVLGTLGVLRVLGVLGVLRVRAMPGVRGGLEVRGALEVLLVPVLLVLL